MHVSTAIFSHHPYEACRSCHVCQVAMGGHWLLLAQWAPHKTGRNKQCCLALLFNYWECPILPEPCTLNTRDLLESNEEVWSENGSFKRGAKLGWFCFEMISSRAGLPFLICTTAKQVMFRAVSQFVCIFVTICSDINTNGQTCFSLEFSKYQSWPNKDLDPGLLNIGRLCTFWCCSL